MYISNILHFLDESGNIPKEMPKEGREMAGFLFLVIDSATQAQNKCHVRCFEKGCVGEIQSVIAKNQIVWKCSKCENEGLISGWQNTKWDNRK